jgi:hypothetical protein
LTWYAFLDRVAAMIASAQATDFAADLCRLQGLLETLRLGLQGLHDRTPIAHEEGNLEDLREEPDFSTRLRSTLRCILTDFVEPALRDLGQLAKDLPVS